MIALYLRCVSAAIALHLRCVRALRCVAFALLLRFNCALLLCVACLFVILLLRCFCCVCVAFTLRLRRVNTAFACVAIAKRLHYICNCALIALELRFDCAYIAMCLCCVFAAISIVQRLRLRGI